MTKDFRWLVIILGNCILLFLVQWVNHSLASVLLHVFPFALYIFVPLILLPFTSGLLSVFITGLILDVSVGFSFGVMAVILSVVYTAAYSFRHHFKIYSGWHNMLILQSANAIVFALLLEIIDPSNYGHAGFWLSMVINLIFTQFILLIVAPWFLDLQNSLLYLLNFGSLEKSKDS